MEKIDPISREHFCINALTIRSALYGPAAETIVYSELLKAWVMHNEEYASYPLVACPFCGLKLI